MVSDMHVLPVALERVSKPQDRYLRWFSARRASEFRRAKLGDAQAITVSHIVTSNDGKLAYFKNSKAGCTTVTAAIYQYNYQQPLETNAHSKELDLRQGRQHWEANVDAINNGATAFSFVRNPASRARSAFINFFVDKTNRSAHRHFPALESRGFSLKDDLSYQFDVFLAYAEESLSLCPELTDRHWRHQTLNVGLNMFPLAFVGKLEDGLDEGLAKVAELAGCAPILVDKNRNESSRVDFTPSQDHVKKIERLYAEDYEAFGY